MSIGDFQQMLDQNVLRHEQRRGELIGLDLDRFFPMVATQRSRAISQSHTQNGTPAAPAFGNLRTRRAT
jgi:hypothetical protein